MKARALLFGLIALALSATPSRADSPDESMCYRAGDLDVSQATVVAACARAVRRAKPGDRAMLYLFSGKAASIGGDFDRAFADIEQATRLYGSSRRIGIRARGDIWFRKNELDRAVAEYDDIIQNDIADGESILKRSSVFAVRREFDRMISRASEYLAQTNLAYAKYVLIHRALAYFYAGSPVQAAADLKRAIEIDPKATSALDALYWHEIIGKRHNLPPLPDHLKRAVTQNDPTDLSVRLLLGQATKADIERQIGRRSGTQAARKEKIFACYPIYFAGLWALRNGNQQDAAEYLRRVDDECIKDPDQDYLKNWRSWLPALVLNGMPDPASAHPSSSAPSGPGTQQQTPGGSPSIPRAASAPPSGKMDNNFATADEDRGDAARRDYELTAQVGTREAWEAYLATHPSGLYAALARAQLEKLGAK